MANRLKADELNSFEEYARDYFSVMSLTNQQKRRREELSKDMLDAFLFLFALAEEAIEKNVSDYSFVLDNFADEYEKVVLSHAEKDEYVDDYITKATDNIFQTTMLMATAYALSEERARSLAVNEANSVENYEDLRIATRNGKTSKTWIAIEDERTRAEHAMMDGKTIAIDDYFQFSDCKMLTAHDFVNGTAKQNSNCRCSVSYGNKTVSKPSGNENAETETSNKNMDKSTRYDREAYSDAVLKRRIDALGENEVTSRAIYNRIKETLKHRDGTHFEDLTFINSESGISKINKNYDYYDKEKGISACVPTKSMEKMVKDAEPETIIGMHNHPTSAVPSPNDLARASERQYKYGLAVGHNGTIFKYTVADVYDVGFSKLHLDILETALYTDDTKTIDQAIEGLRNYGVDLEVLDYEGDN